MYVLYAWVQTTEWMLILNEYLYWVDSVLKYVFELPNMLVNSILYF